MKFLQRLICILSMILYTSSQCTEGCLSCNGEDKCLFCDFQNGYYFRDYGCIQSNISNCSLLDLNGLCLYCDAHYYLDVPNNKCIEVDSSTFDINCSLYSNEQNCIICSGDVYPLSGKCSDVVSENMISHCEAYVGPKECYKCKDGYILNYERTACRTNSSETSGNCLLFSNIRCKTCPDGYSQTEDFARILLQQAISNAHKDSYNDNVLLLQQTYLQKAIDPIFHNKISIQDSCVAYTIDNCSTYSDFRTCLSCKSGFYLSNNYCYGYPEESIPHCMIYNSGSSCYKCQDGYFLHSSSSCELVEKIDNCISYDGSDNQTTCILCERNYYLKLHSNSCTLRTNFVDKCQNYSKTLDECESCFNSDIRYQITDDGLMCLKEVGNCLVYEPSNITTERLICSQCQNGYFLNNEEDYCQLGTVQNCMVYVIDQNYCSECENGYYLSTDSNGDQICTKSTQVEGCSIYNNQTEDQCQTCKDEYYLFSQNTNCIKVAIDGCDQYSSRTTCMVCKDGYDFVSNQECRELPENSYCVKSIQGQCTQCIDQYFLYEGKCYPAFSYKQHQCAKKEFTDSGNYYLNGECLICQSYAISYNMKNKYICMNDTELENIFSTKFHFPYCASYYIDSSDQIKCYQCIEGYRFDSSSGSQQCVSSCGIQQVEFNESLIVSNGKLIFVNTKICVDATHGYFDYVDQYAQLPTFQGYYKPLIYNDNFVFKNNHSQVTNYTLAIHSNLSNIYVYQGVYKFPLNTLTYNINDLTKEIDECKMYSDIFDDGNEIYNGCTTCNFGFFGRIKNFDIEYCHQYEDQEFNTANLNCEVCIHKYYPINNGRICQEIIIPGCMRFNLEDPLCEQCYDGYYLSSDNSQCLIYTFEQANCLYYNLFADECLVCKDGYILKSNNKKCFKKIDNCVSHDVTGSSILCTFCDSNYALNTGGSVCQKIDSDYCWFNENGQFLNDCLLYEAKLTIQQTNQCLVPTTISNCSYYKGPNECEICKEGYYLYQSDACCQYTTFLANGDTITCSGTQQNCHQFKYNEDTSSEQCIKCDMGYHLSNGNNCCPIGQHYDHVQTTCVTDLFYNDQEGYNDPKCILWDYQNKICHICLDEHYKSQNHCCPNGTYYKNSTDGCVDIFQDLGINNCKQYDTVESECVMCQNDSVAPQCCTDLQYLNEENCSEIPSEATNCSSFDESKGCICDDQITGIYRSNENDFQFKCCTEESEYYDIQSQSCETVTSPINNCSHYDQTQLCTQCKASYNLQEESVGNFVCCQDGEMYNGVECVSINDVYESCNIVDKSSFNNYMNTALTNVHYYDYMCSQCDTNKYINEKGICSEIPISYQIDIKKNNQVDQFDSCISLDYTDDENYTCGECQIGYHFELNNSKCCMDGSFITESLSDCQLIYGNVNHCMIYDLENDQCLDLDGQTFTTSQQDFINVLEDYGSCAHTKYSEYIFNSTNKKCELKSQTAQPKIPNCIEDDGTNCTQCKKGYSALNTSCVKQCVDDYNTNCTLCLEGYANIDSTASVNTTQCSKQNDPNDVDNSRPNKNCQHYTTSDDINFTCIKCYQGFYLTNDVCCQYGYYYDVNLTTCRKYQNPYCSQIDNSQIGAQTGVMNCTKCFITDDFCDDKDSILFDVDKLDYNIGIDRASLINSTTYQNALKKIIYHDYKNIWMSTQSQCCPHGQSFDNDKKGCVEINIDHCLEGSYNDTTKSFQCSKCEIGYQINQSSKCSLISTSNCNVQQKNYDGVLKDSYLSNGHCCVQGTYWNDDEQKCLAIPDPFCLKASNKSFCDQCSTGFQPVYSESNIKFNLVVKNYNILSRCPLFEDYYSYQPCMPNQYKLIEPLTNVYSYTQIGLKMQNCLIFDQETLKCTKCDFYSYMSDSYGQCCPLYTTLYKGRCISSDNFNMLDKCLYFTEDNLCQTCKQGYTSQHGFCCENGYYLDQQTLSCSYYYPDCKQYSYEHNKCISCLGGYYMSEGHCCRFGHQWSKSEQQCVEFTASHLFGCKRGSKDNFCAECNQQVQEYESQTSEQNQTIYTYYYLQNGICLPFGTLPQTVYYIDEAIILGGDQTNSRSIIPLKQSYQKLLEKNMNYIYSCVQFDGYNNCTQCLSGYNLYDISEILQFDISKVVKNTFICCPSGEYPQVLEINSAWNVFCKKDILNLECDQFYYTGSEYLCETCNDTDFYVSDGHCCDRVYAWDNDTKICSEIFNNYAYNCNKVNNDECIECKSGYYLTKVNGNGYCCEQDKYFNPISRNCELISTILPESLKCTKLNLAGDPICIECYDNSIPNIIKNVVKYVSSSDQTCIQSELSTSCSQIDNSNTCILCREGYYMSNSLCCLEETYNNGGVCVDIPDTNCLQYDGECIKCITDYHPYGNPGNKDPDPTFSIANCAAAYSNVDDFCYSCMFGYQIDSTSVTCTAINSDVQTMYDYLNYCSQSANGKQCEQCQELSGYYLSSPICCKESYGVVQNQDDNICIKLTFQPQVSNCQKINNNQCIECRMLEGFFLAYYSETDYKCCMMNYFYDKTLDMCKPIATNYDSLSLVDCNLFTLDDNDVLQCRNPTENELEFITIPCSNNKYLTNQRCCSESYFYVEDGNNCQLITQLDDTGNNLLIGCLQVDSDNKCIKCSYGGGIDYVLSEGFCCELNKHYDSQTKQCVDNYDSTNCVMQEWNQKNQQYECAHCTTINGSPSSNQYYPACCNLTAYLNTSNTCQDYVQNDDDDVLPVIDKNLRCKIMNQSGQCTECYDGFYVTGNKCCPDGYYYDDTNGCTEFTVNCLRSSSQFDDELHCDKCYANGILYTSFNGKCCQQNNYIYTSALQNNNKKYCVNIDDLITNCEKYNGSKCLQCKSNYNLSKGICCQVGYYAEYFLDDILRCVKNSGVDNCLINSTSTECEVCEYSHFLTSEKKCCQYGKVTSDDSNCFAVADCVSETVQGSGICEQCVENTTLFSENVINQSNVEITVQMCCQLYTYFKVLSYDEYYCMGIETLMSNCKNIDYENFECQTCMDGYYKSKNLCCEYGEQFSKGQCVIGTIEYCEKYIDEDCDQCETNYYVSNNHCCPLHRYWSKEQQQCIGGESTLCEEYQDSSSSKCNTCQDSLSYLSHEHCCLYGQYYDLVENQCIDIPIQECKILNDNNTCDECNSDYYRTLDLKNCCNEFGFVSNDNTNQDCYLGNTYNDLYDYCNDWSPQTLLCSGCFDGAYLSDPNKGVCCELGDYFDGTNCTTIQITNCIQQIGNDCKQCDSQFQYKESNNTCVQILSNCIEFDSENNVCITCNSSTYLTHNHCCDNGEIYNDTICAAGSVTNCVEYDNTDLCIKCKDAYYVTNSGNRCTLKGYYFDGTSDQIGTIRNCASYSDQLGNICSKCIASHSLINIQSPFNIILSSSTSSITIPPSNPLKTICILGSIDNCQSSEMSVESDTNRITCNQCDKGMFTSSFTDEFQVDIHMPDNCVYMINQKTYNTSSFQCYQCHEDYYLNDQFVCTARSNTNNCAKRSRNQDGCLSCVYGYYLDGINCVAYGNTCLYRENSTFCKVCVPMLHYTYKNPVNWDCLDITDFADENVIANPPAYTNGFIESCSEHHQCKNVFYNNLSLTFQNYFSCHVCNDENRIPFISLSVSSSGAIRGLKRFSRLINTGLKLNTFLNDQESKQSECFLKDFSEFNIQQSASLFPSNCALGLLNSDFEINLTQSSYNQQGTFNYQQATAICLECKPGYRPVRYSGFLNMVTECILITNCASGINGKSFSQCDECEEGYHFQYSSQSGSGGFDKTYCLQSISNHDPLCYVFNELTKKCIACRYGYSLNYDGKCELLVTAFCDGVGTTLQDYTINDYDIVYYRGEQGCTKCQNGYSRLFITENDYNCIASNYSKNPTSPTTIYVQNCEFYNNSYQENSSHPLICQKCKQNYLLTTSNTCIQITTYLQHCTLAQSSTRCSSCQSSYYLVNNVCITGHLEYCQEYKNGTSKLECLSCDNYYYLTSQGTCERGELANCLEFNGLSSCNKCDDNYQLITVHGGQDYCMPLSGLDNNCASGSLNENSFRSFQLVCDSCKDGYYLEPQSSNNVCLVIQLVKNCISYDKNNSFQQSTLKCLQCSENYYLQDNECVRRTKMFQNCMEYTTDADTCSSCEDGYYVSIDGESCIGNPNGIIGCDIYSDDTTCVKCSSQYYLDSSDCYPLSSGNDVENCNNYNSSQQCMGCISGYSLEDGLCNLQVVENCEIFDTSKSCAVCQNGYGLKVQDDVNICVTLPVIDGCVSQSQIEPYECLVCENERYLNNSICELIETDNLIPNCLTYDTNKLCSRCAPNFFLGVQSSECIPFAEDVICQELAETTENFCTFCQLGYQLNNKGVCVESPEQNLSNCFLSSYEDSSQCAICQSNYYMNSDHECKEKSLIDQNTLTNLNNSHVRALEIFVVLIAFMIWLQ